MTTYEGTTAGNLKERQGFRAEDFYRVGDDIFINPDTPTRGYQNYRLYRAKGWVKGEQLSVLYLIVVDLEDLDSIPFRDSAEDGDLQVYRVVVRSH